MKYIAWFSKDTIYQEVFHSHLEPTLKQYNLDYHVYEEPNYNKWVYNVAHKPEVILKALKEFKQPIVVLDVDCKITGEPELFNRIKVDNFDIACHYLDWATWYNRVGETKKELLTGTMWFNYNERVLAFLSKWAQNTLAQKCTDQITIPHLLENEFKDIRVCKLPLEYVYINSLPNGQEPFVKVKNPIITHYQASRTAKKGAL